MADPIPSILTSKPTKATAEPKTPSPIYKPRGGASSFDSSKYNIDQFQYPSDLMGSAGEYGGNYVIFYINVATDSKLLSGGVEQTVSDIPPRDQGSLVGLAQSSVGQVSSATTDIGGVNSGNVVN